MKTGVPNTRHNSAKQLAAVNSIIAEFLLRHIADADTVVRRAEIVAALAQLPPERRQQMASAVDTVCKSITQQGGVARVRFELAERDGQRYLQVAVTEEPADPESRGDGDAPAFDANKLLSRSWQHLRELVDRIETVGRPLHCATIRLAQVLPPAFTPPTDAEVTEWYKIIQANTPLDALAFALERAHNLTMALGNARHRETLEHEIAQRSSDAENRILLSLVTTKTKNAIAIMDPRGVILWVNNAFVQMTGYDFDAAVGKRLGEVIIGPHTHKDTVTTLTAAFDAGQEWTGELMRYRRDRQTYWVESNLIPIHDAAGRLARWVVIDTDITRWHQTEIALRDAKDAAEERNRAKTEFLANLSHEIRTPMNVILGMTDLALDTQLDIQQREYLETVRSSADALLHLLDDILDISKIEAGKLALEQIDFDLVTLIRKTLKPLQVAAREKGLKLQADLPDDLPRYVRGDPTRLRQILTNLVGNAIKFTLRGEVAVAVSHSGTPGDELDLRFSVRDTGIGIPPDKQDTIFEAFSQADTSTSRRFGGTGLGLTISARLVRLMRGRIWFDSTVGAGTTFFFTVAVQRGDPQAATAQQPRESGHAGGKSPTVVSLNVLVADDHEANRKLVVTVLEKRGHRCVEAADGNAVVALAQQQPFDVILMDIQMPGMDGIEATTFLRRMEAGSEQHVSIIALTAHAMASDRDRCLAAGMDAYLAKPLRPSELVETVESLPTARHPTNAAPQTPRDSSPSVPAFDFSLALESLDHEIDLLLDQMQFFTRDGPQLVAQIDTAIGAQDPSTVERAAHRLKGLLARYAYTEAVDLALRLERLGHAKTLDGAALLLRELAGHVERLIAAIREYIVEHGRNGPTP